MSEKWGDQIAGPGEECCLVLAAHQSWVFYVIFCVFSWGNIWKAKSITQTFLLWNHAVVIDAVCVLALCIMQGLTGNVCCLVGIICHSKTFIYLSALMVSLQMCKLPLPLVLMHPHTIRNAGFLTEPDGLSSFKSGGHGVHDIHKEFQIFIRLTEEVLLFASVHFKWALVQRRWQLFCIMFTNGFFFAW